MNKIPPIEKVYEAWSAIADGRVTLISDTEANVESSDRERTYTVIYDEATHTYASDDNATYWRGYPGYPVIAVMMLRGQLPLAPDIAEWSGINWNVLNKEYHRDYAAAVDHIASERHIDVNHAQRQAAQVMDALSKAPYSTKRL